MAKEQRVQCLQIDCMHSLPGLAGCENRQMADSVPTSSDVLFALACPETDVRTRVAALAS